jgi:hypothetical protein
LVFGEPGRQLAWAKFWLIKCHHDDALPDVVGNAVWMPITPKGGPWTPIRGQIWKPFDNQIEDSLLGKASGRPVSLRRDDEDFVVVFQSKEIAVFRHQDAAALRKACRFIRWKYRQRYLSFPRRPLITAGRCVAKEIRRLVATEWIVTT